MQRHLSTLCVRPSPWVPCLRCLAVDNMLEVSLQKQDGMHWWSSILKGDPIIDTQKVRAPAALHDL